MDSLLANYVSSDEEEREEEKQVENQQQSGDSSSSRPSSLLSSLPQPKSSPLFRSLRPPKQSSIPTLFSEQDPKPTKSSSLFTSLPQPKQSLEPTKPSSVFSSLPQPKPQNLQKPIENCLNPEPQTKRVVQIQLPVNPISTKLNDDDEDDEEDEDRERKRRKESESLSQTPSVKSFLSSIPAPRSSATLGALPSLGSGRRSILETETSGTNSHGFQLDNDSSNDQNVSSYTENYDNHANYDSSTYENSWNYANHEDYGSYQPGMDQNVDGQVQYGLSGSETGNYENYNNYGDAYGQYESNWAGGSPMMAPDISGSVESSVRLPQRRRRNEVPTEIVEVKQDELIKNRPREDQVKLTGIAFGPSYQPVSTKGKPSKLHKRKHQIGSLFFDMKQKEMELAERRAKGFLTKAETQAKYGW